MLDPRTFNARTCSRSSISVPSLLGLGFRTPPKSKHVLFARLSICHTITLLTRKVCGSDFAQKALELITEMALISMDTGKVFTARCYASAVLDIGLCPSVSCLCLCLSQVSVLLKRKNVGSHKQHHTIAQGL